MSSAAKIMIVREDFSILGSPVDPDATAAGFESRFFAVLRDNHPDVVVLDLTRASGAGLEAIRTLRRKSAVPILVVHAADDVHIEDYVVCGAASRVVAPIDLVQLNAAIHRIMALNGSSSVAASTSSTALRFGGVVFDPDRNAIIGPKGEKAVLTTLENDILLFMAGRARAVCARAEIAQALYGNNMPATDRAIDVIVKRLRTKLDSVDEERGGDLIKTEFRRGYILAADVTQGAAG